MNKKKFRFCIRNVLSVYLAKKMSEAVIYLIGFFSNRPILSCQRLEIGFHGRCPWISDFMGVFETLALLRGTIEFSFIQLDHFFKFFKYIKLSWACMDWAVSKYQLFLNKSLLFITFI